MNILIFCSWLDKESNIGVFFREQAAVLKPEFNPILVVFRRTNYSLKNKFKKHFDVTLGYTIDGIKIIEVYYPYFLNAIEKINKLLRDRAIYYLHKFLVIEGIHVSIIHAQSIFDAGFWAHEYSIRFNIPYLLTEHNQFSLRDVSLQKQKLVDSILKKSKKNLVVSSDKIRQFAANGYFYDFINVGNLIMDDFYCRSLNKTTDSIKVITIGAFHHLKDHKTMFDALDKLDKTSKRQLKLTWIGYNSWGSDQTINIKKFINNYSFDNIELELIPLLDRVGIATKLNESDLFLFSSISEGMPVSVLEALACGIPVLTSNCGGVDELIDDGNGRIYPVKDSNALFLLLSDYIHDKIKFKSSKEISFDILNKFSKSVFKRQMINIYNSCLE